jgi:hypothetical protein
MHKHPEDMGPKGAHETIYNGPTPTTIYDWLGVEFAVLEAPSYQTQHVGTQSETLHGAADSARGQGEQRTVEVHFTYELPDSTIICVSTRRDDGSTPTLLHHQWAALVNYELNLMGRRGGPPWGTGRPPAEFETRLDLNNPPPTTATCHLTVNGVNQPWGIIAISDISTGLPLAACGGHLGSSFIAVAGPEAAFNGIKLRTWPTDVAT